MSEAVVARAAPKVSADAILRASGVLWSIPAAIGQWIFAYYIAVQYGASAFAGNWPAWNEIMHGGLIAGDFAGNVAMIIHIAIAFWITIAGTLQLMPFVRNNARGFHRWNGRFYVVIALVTSVAAIYMTWARDQLGGVASNVGTTINGLLIVVFALMTWRLAMARRFEDHHRWALRLFIAVSGVWFQRLMYGGLIVIVQGRPPGMTDDLSGPTNVAVVYGSYLLPLAVLELYLWAKRSGAAAKFATAGVMTLAAGATAIGVVGATLIMWLPRIDPAPSNASDLEVRMDRDFGGKSCPGSVTRRRRSSRSCDKLKCSRRKAPRSPRAPRQSVSPKLRIFVGAKNLAA